MPTFRLNRQSVSAEIIPEKDKYKLKFDFNLGIKDEVKAMAGSRWLAPYWVVNKGHRNDFALGFLKGEPVFNRYLKELEPFTPSRDACFKHQVLMCQHVITRKMCVIAAEMGCVDGSAIIHVNRAGRGFKMTLADLYNRWSGQEGKWDLSIPTYIRSRKGNELGLNLIKNVIWKGLKETIRITTKRGYQIVVTPDHEMAQPDLSYKPAGELVVGDKLVVNGKWKDKDGYIRVGGLKGKHSRWTTGGVYEHILVMEEKIGRYVRVDEIVHHKNEIKDDNRPENLELLTGSVEHGKLHGDKNRSNLHNGRTQILPDVDQIVSIETAGPKYVYDVVCDDPYRNFVANGVVVHNSGKSLASIEFLEYLVKTLTPRPEVWYVAPKVALLSVKLDYAKWGARFYPQFMTFHDATKHLTNWTKERPPPRILVVDESSRVKSPDAKQSQAMLHLANAMRDHWGDEAYIILMSGSPAPKSPLDWWMQCEIARPGFIREGDINKFRHRMAVIKKVVGDSGVAYPKLLTFKDDENKCDICGRLKEHEIHDVDIKAQMTYVAGSSIEDQMHQFKPCVNEVDKLYRRLKGLVLVIRKKDCLDLPEKVYRVVKLKPTKYMMGLAKTVRKTAGTAANALNLARQLSDGFQYVEKLVGTITCPNCKGDKKEKLPNWVEVPDGDHVRLEQRGETEVPCTHCSGRGSWKEYKTEVVETDTPKVQALLEILEEKDDDGRIVIFASYQGAIDRILATVAKAKWNFIRRDGRGWYSDLPTNDPAEMLTAFQDQKTENRIAFVAHPASAGMGLTLTASDTIVYFSNDFNAESRIQSEDRIHRPGCRSFVQLVKCFVASWNVMN